MYILRRAERERAKPNLKRRRKRRSRRKEKKRDRAKARKKGARENVVLEQGRQLIFVVKSDFGRFTT